MKPFLQTSLKNSTIELWKEILEGNTLPSLGLFAYVTDSGVDQIITHLSRYFNNSRHCRWVLGFDYGRSQPTAIKKLAEIGNSEIRIYDGDYVVKSRGFIPRKSYHLKTAFTLRANDIPERQLVGSGNISASGLLSGVEAGCIVEYSVLNSEDQNTMATSISEIWDSATPVANVLSQYEMVYRQMSVPKLTMSPQGNINCTKLFWIDVGYVTKNRGSSKPGNQFDLPRGAHIRLGLKENLHPSLNSILGKLKIRTTTDDIVERVLRFGNNSMEKLTLPTPEQYGYQCYDGKILIFKIGKKEISLEALEHDDFFKVYGNSIVEYQTMQSGRLYGTIIQQEDEVLPLKSDLPFNSEHK